MEIKELDKKQLVLLTLLITFVVSIATGIVTVSLMNQVPKSVPQTINNVIQRTIEKVTTVEAPSTPTTSTATAPDTTTANSGVVTNGEQVLIPIYPADADNKTDSKSDTKPTATTTGATPASSTTAVSTNSPAANTSSTVVGSTQAASAAGATDTTSDPKTTDPKVEGPKPLGYGVLISDIGLVLVDSTILTDKDVYKVVLDKTDFDALVVKKYGNGFTILQIRPQKAAEPVKTPAKEGDSAPVDKKV
jgi:cytoskeletal protein RodZ